MFNCLNKRLFANLVLGAVFLFLLFINLRVFHNNIIGWTLLIFYLFFLGYKWKFIFAKAHRLDKKLVELKILGCFAVIVLLGLFSSAAIVFYRFTIDAIIGVFAFVWLLTLIIETMARLVVSGDEESRVEEEKLVVFDRQFWILPFGFFFLVFVFIFLCFTTRLGAESASTPWLFISRQYLALFLISVFLVGVSVFSKYRAKAVLLMIIFLTLLSHLYLPLSHKMPWGGDVWRLMSVEKALINGQSIPPALFGGEVAMRNVGNFSLPAVFVQPHKYSYGPLWGLSVILTRVTGVNLLSLNRWLMPIVWSFTMPVLLSRLGCLLFQSRRRGLLLAWLALLPFPFQSLGGLTLPVGLGHLFFFFVFWLWIEHWHSESRRTKWLAAAFSVFLIFNYALHFILIWSVIILRWLWKKGGRLLSIVLALMIFPTVELISRYSYLPTRLNLWQGLKQFVGQFTGWFYASAIRPHDIFSGNVIFNHTPSYAFVSNFLLYWRWWLIPAMLALWAIVFYGWWTSRDREKRTWSAVWVMFAVTFGGYIIGWYFLEGDRLFVRRMDLFLSVLILILFISGLESVLIKLKQRTNFLRWAVLCAVFVFSFFITATYASGPDARVVDVQNEYNVAEYIWRSRDGAGDNRCVLADTWTLLPLEYFSAGQIVGGGFPMDYNFGQTSRVALFEKFSKNPERQDLSAMKKLTGANQCWFAQSIANLSQITVDKIIAITGEEPRRVNDVLLWLINL